MAILMMCGNCGKTKFNVSFNGNSHHMPNDLIVTCVYCGSQSVISLMAKLTVDMCPDSDGSLCPAIDYRELQVMADDIEIEKERK